MAKLYPPYIEGTLPAFWLDEEGNGTITIPFALNKAVSSADIKGMYVKIKTVQNDILINSFRISNDPDLTNYKIEIPVKNFKAQNWELTIGQYYKLQLAFESQDNEIGYYSTVGVIKCTSKPEVIILDGSDKELDKNGVNNNRLEYIGQYKQKVDVTEKVYSSRFTITDLKGNEIATTGDVLHNVENNPNSYTSTDSMYFNRDLEFGEIYKIWYTVTTNNGLVVDSYKYLLTQQKSLSMEFDGSLKAKLNYEEGFIDISTVAGEKSIVDGSFVLSREDSLNPGVWEELTRFTLNHEHPDKMIFRDFTIEQGKTYTYSIQQYNINGIYSDRKKSNQIYADFEDMFLFDGERQLKLIFNPQISSFKTQLAETRTETIGNKYPFFFRNARVEYKTFPITALISMQIDDNEFFINYEDILREKFTRERHDSKRDKKLNPDVYSYNSEINKNYASERLFKLEVLDWFNNGKVKLFKSPAEGNYIVRLMDTSLSPENALGRMLHNINTTAYECADCIYSNLVQYGIIEDPNSLVDKEDVYVDSWTEESVSELYNELFDNSGVQTEDFYPNAVGNGSDEYYTDNLLTKSSDLPAGEAYTKTLQFRDMMPGTKIRLVFARNGEYNQDDEKDYEDIIIGATGNYYADDIDPVYGIYMVQTNNAQSNTSLPAGVAGAGASHNYPVSLEGSLLYQSKVPVRTKFNSIEDTDTSVGEYKQFVGPIEDLVENLTTTRDEITYISMSRYFKRPIGYLFYNPDEFTEYPEDIYEYDNSGNRVLIEAYDGKLYRETTFKGKVFSEEENMSYSPFAIYVLKSPNVSVEGQKRNILEHMYGENPTAESIHKADHLFEQYYIDRYLLAQSAEDMLVERTLLAKRLAAGEDVQGIIDALADEPVYVLDPWTGKIYVVGENYLYDSNIIYNNEPIDLKEIQRYDLDGLEPKETTLAIGNGVYGEVFYQKVTTHYTLEQAGSGSLKQAKNSYESALEDLEELRTRGETPTHYQLADLDIKYAEYNKELTTAINNWNKRETDLEE